MSDYKPGTVAVATVRGVKGVRVFRRHSPDTGVDDWAYNPDPARGLNYSCDSDLANVVTDVRPLVVLDIQGQGSLDRAWANTEAAMKEGHTLPIALERLRDDIRAQTKPPRIPEPGLWAVVEARCPDSGPHRWHFVRDADRSVFRWTAIGTGAQFGWDQLEEPTLVHEGVQP